MADVIEVIHKINYEVNDADLNRVTDVIRTQITEITRLSNQLVGLQNTLANTSAANIAQLGKLSTEINKITALLDNATAKTKGLISGIGKGFSNSELAKFGDKVFDVVPDLVKSLSEIEVSSNGAIASLVGFAGKINPVVSVVSLLLPVVIDLGKALFDVGEDADKIGEQADKIDDFSKKLGQSASGEITNLLELKTQIENVKDKYADRKTAMDELLKSYPEHFDKLREEELLAGKVGDAYAKIIGNILLKSQLEVYGDKLKEELRGLVELKDEIDKLASKENIPLTSKTGSNGFPQYDVNQFDRNVLANQVNKLAIKTTDNPSNGGVFGPLGKTLEDTTKPLLPVPSPALYGKLLNYQNKTITISGLLDIISSLQTKLPKDAAVSSTRVTTNSDSGKGLTAREKMEIAPLTAGAGFDDNIEQAKQIEIPKYTDKEQLAADKRKEHLEKLKETYKTLAQAAVDAFNAIYEAQLKSLDKEIDVRKERVAKATELAKKGETDQLKAEQDRLDKATEARDAAAKKQMQINAIVQASNQALALTEAIGAVVKAAAEGDPYTIAFRVAAAVAALVAGIAAISSAFGQLNSGFAEGGYTGHGGKYQPAGIVHKGEFVMDAANTQRYRPLLEAMHTGAFPVPVFKQTGGINSQYASRREMSGVEKKLDALIGAVEASQTNVNARVDERGVAIITQRYQKAERRRWS